MALPPREDSNASLTSLVSTGGIPLHSSEHYLRACDITLYHTLVVVKLQNEFHRYLLNSSLLNLYWTIQEDPPNKKYFFKSIYKRPSSEVSNMKNTTDLKNYSVLGSLLKKN